MKSIKLLQQFYKADKARNPWAIAWAIIANPKKVNPLYTEQVAAAGNDVEKKKALAAKIAGGIESNVFNSIDEKIEIFDDTLDEKTYKLLEQLYTKSKGIKKLQKKLPMEALARWWLGGTINEISRGISEPTPAQQREFERQIQRAMRRRGKNLNKNNSLQKLKTFFQKDGNDTYIKRTPEKNAVNLSEDILQKLVSFPPFQGARFDPSSHRWVKPETYGQAYNVRGGKKRIRGSGTGVHERSISGHGKGRIRGEGAGRKFKGETDLAAQRRKEGFTHGKVKKR